MLKVGDKVQFWHDIILYKKNVIYTVSDVKDHYKSTELNPSVANDLRQIKLFEKTGVFSSFEFVKFVNYRIRKLNKLSEL